MYKNKKNALSSLIAILLLIGLAVFALTVFQTWFKTYSSSILVDIEEESLFDDIIRIESISRGMLYLYSEKNDSYINKIRINDIDCIGDFYLLKGLNIINVEDCLGDIDVQLFEILLITDKNIISEEIFIKDLIEHSSFLNFVFPTPADTARIKNSQFISRTRINSSNLTNIIYNFNDENFTIYDNSLILMLNFDNRSDLGENDTHIKDLSISNHDVEMISSVAIGDGYYNKGIVVQGNNDGLDLGTGFDFSGTNSFTLSVWVKQNGNSATHSSLVSKYNRDTASPKEMSLYIYSTGEVVFLRECIPYNFETNYILPNNQWVHLTITYNGSVRTFYLNGLFNNSESHSCSVTPRPTGITTIGTFKRNVGYSESFNGTIDEVKIWNRSLSAEEVKLNYLSNLQKYDSTKWFLDIKQINLTQNIYDYQVFAQNSFGENGSTKKRSIEILN